MPDMLNTLKVITRNGALDLKQVSKVLDHFPDLKYKLISLSSIDHKANVHLLPSNSSFNILPAEADQAILSGDADLVVQSAEDLTYPLPAGLEIVALLKALDPGDSTQNKEKFAIIALANRPELSAFFATRDIRNQFGKIPLLDLARATLTCSHWVATKHWHNRI